MLSGWQAITWTQDDPHSQTIPWGPSHHLRTPKLGWTPLSCGTAGCRQINSILANIGNKNSNSNSNFETVPLLMKYFNISIDYLFYQFFTILEIKVALISYSLSKATKNNGLIALIRPLFAVPWPEWGIYKIGNCFRCKQQLSAIVRCSVQKKQLSAVAVVCKQQLSAVVRCSVQMAVVSGS